MCDTQSTLRLYFWNRIHLDIYRIRWWRPTGAQGIGTKNVVPFRSTHREREMDGCCRLGASDDKWPPESAALGSVANWSEPLCARARGYQRPCFGMYRPRSCGWSVCLWYFFGSRIDICVAISIIQLNFVQIKYLLWIWRRSVVGRSGCGAVVGPQNRRVNLVEKRMSTTTRGCLRRVINELMLYDF